MSRRVIVEFTHNFERNLEEIEQFLLEQDAAGTFVALIDHLLDTLVPNLEQFPDLGADFLARRPQSTQGAARIRSLQARLGAGTTLREYIAGDFIVLYAARDARRWLLAVRHHKQLSYDLRTHWVR